MNRVGIVGYANTPFTKEEQKIESILHNSANQLFKNNLEIDKKLIDSVQFQQITIQNICQQFWQKW